MKITDFLVLVFHEFMKHAMYMYGSFVIFDRILTLAGITPFFLEGNDALVLGLSLAFTCFSLF